MVQLYNLKCPRCYYYFFSCIISLIKDKTRWTNSFSKLAESNILRSRIARAIGFVCCTESHEGDSKFLPTIVAVYF